MESRMPPRPDLHGLLLKANNAVLSELTNMYADMRRYLQKQEREMVVRIQTTLQEIQERPDSNQQAKRPS